jgi:Fe-S cluster assembly protein SufB
MDKQVNDWADLPDSVKNTWDRLGIPEAEKKYLAGVTAQYECLRGSTKVWTTSGMRAIKELGPGDEVLSLDEDSKQIVTSTVVGQRCSGDKEIFEIRARGRVIGASANHPFLVLRDERLPGRERRRYAARWLPVEQLVPGDLVAVATDTPDWGAPAALRRPDLESRPEASRLPSETSDDFCWWAGVYLGDGYLHHRGPWTAVEIAVDRSDTGLVEEIIRVTEELFGVQMSLASDGFRLTGRGTAALAEFIELNGLGGNAHTKRVPAWSYGLPRSQRLSFVSGFLDADGHPRTTSAGLIEDVEELVELTRPGASDCVASDASSEMLGFVRVDSIEPVGVEPVYDIEVAGRHNFVAEGFVVHNSEVVYHRNREDLERLGVFFSDMDSGIREHPEIVRKWFGKIIPPNDNKFAALNSAVWSGGSFIYVPPGVKVDMPLQAYFRINAENMGQFERTLIIADEGSEVHYVEGCSAPVYSTDSLHSAVVELVAMPGSRITYTTIQNWSNNVYNLVTKRARAEAEAHVAWIDGNIGSRLTMKYPSVYLMGPKASGEVLSVAYAGEGQQQDTGAKMYHVAPETTSTIVSKSISKDGGVTTYRGKVHVDPGAKHAKSFVRCDALMLDEKSTSYTKPYMEVEERDAQIGHEATVSKVGEDQLFYLMSRGLSEAQATGMIVNGFIEPVTRTLPMEYAVEWSRLIELQMEGSVG